MNNGWLFWLWQHSLSWWRHQIQTFSALLPFVRGIYRSPVDSPHKGQWRGALMFSLIWRWTNDWANSRDAGDLKCHRARYDVIVIWKWCHGQFIMHYNSAGNVYDSKHALNVLETSVILLWTVSNQLRLRQNGCHFADGIFKYIFLNEDFWISNNIPLKYVPYQGVIDNMSALVQMNFGAYQATYNYLIQWWPCTSTHMPQFSPLEECLRARLKCLLSISLITDITLIEFLEAGKTSFMIIGSSPRGIEAPWDAPSSGARETTSAIWLAESRHESAVVCLTKLRISPWTHQSSWL